MTLTRITARSNPRGSVAPQRALLSLIAASLVMVMASSLAAAQAEDSIPASKEDAVYAAMSKVPQKAAARSNPMENDRDAVAAGKKLFGLHCAQCHGEMAQGGRWAPNLLSEQVQRVTPGTLFWILTNGVVRRGMPVWSKLPEPQRWQLVSYLKSLTPTGRGR